MPRQPIENWMQRKAVRFALAVACAFCAGQGIHLFYHPEAGYDVLRGGGEVLMWGGLALLNMSKLHSFSISGVKLAICAGCGLILASWL
jgi:hypothetical protein